MSVILRGLRWLLLPLGLVHLFIVYVRNKLYDYHIFTSISLPLPVMSIGNIQLGGTGKSELVISLLKYLETRGATVGILSRGYLRGIRDSIVVSARQDNKDKFKTVHLGDEPYLFLRNTRKGVLGLGANRYEMGLKILKDHRVDIFIMDDAFQHRKLYRDFDICLVDVSHWPGHPLLVPFSHLRDCKSSLKRANIILLTKYRSDPQKASRLKRKFQRKYRVPVWLAEYQMESLISLSTGEKFSIPEMTGKSVGVFCGIAHPQHFFRMLRDHRCQITFQKVFPDHHPYQIGDVEFLIGEAKSYGIKFLLTTEKDAVKIREVMPKNIGKPVDILVVRIHFQIEAAEQFYSQIHGFFQTHHITSEKNGGL